MKLSKIGTLQCALMKLMTITPVLVTAYCIPMSVVAGGTTFIENAGGAYCVVDGAARRLQRTRCCIDDGATHRTCVFVGYINF